VDKTNQEAEKETGKTNNNNNNNDNNNSINNNNNNNNNNSEHYVLFCHDCFTHLAINASL